MFPNSLFLTFIFLGCQSNVPRFDEDHAFSYLVAQCDFGPRNPGSDGYYACLDYLITELDQSANEIILQDFSYQEQRYNKHYNGENIIARFNPDSEFQTIISAHWDTRPWADQEDLRQDRDQPIIGANDGASGVAILLELAKIMGENAHAYIKQNFSWSKIALDFSRIITKHSDLFITKKRNNNL